MGWPRADPAGSGVPVHRQGRRRRPRYANPSLPQERVRSRPLKHCFRSAALYGFGGNKRETKLPINYCIFPFELLPRPLSCVCVFSSSEPRKSIDHFEDLQKRMSLRLRFPFAPPLHAVSGFGGGRFVLSGFRGWSRRRGFLLRAHDMSFTTTKVCLLCL